MEATLVKEKKAYAQTLGEQELTSYENHLFDLNQYGGANEAERLIKHYSEQNIKLREEDKQILRDNAPEAPNFPLITAEQYNKKSCFGKKGYRKKVKSYFEYRQRFYTEKNKEGEAETKGMKLTRLREEIESGEYYQKSPEAEEMDRIFREQSEDQKFREQENINGQNEIKEMEEHSKKQDDGDYLKGAFEQYTSSFTFQDMNNIARMGGYDERNEAIKDYLRKNPINRELVVRRAVDGVKTIAHMLGMQADKVSEEELKEFLKERMKSGEDLIAQDKGFVSTSLPFAETPYAAGQEGGQIGIEFIIRCKKGTAAINVQSISNVKEEAEVLIAPGTKFKVVDAQLDGKADIMVGNKKSWKIYLESIPVSEEGIKKEGA